MLVEIILALILNSFSSAQNDLCPNLSTCGECIQEPSCIWCLEPTNNTVNCQKNETSSCESNSKVSAEPSLEVIRHNPLRPDVTNLLEPYVQIAPQQIKLKLPKNQEYTVEFKFARAQSPLDLYFLMDASYTMVRYKELISKLGNDLVEAITKHINDYKIGFGSFVDKAVPPFDYFPGKTPNCKNVPNCIRGYSFKNHLNLTTDINDFQKKVNETSTSANIDLPEGGLEALMQVLVCTEQIGWRKDAMHLVVFATDDYFHVAGDGRLVGALRPNDGLCHLIDNEYTEDKELDYPSVSFVNYKSVEKGIHIIFAIAESEDDRSIKKQYEELSKQIELSKYHELTVNSQEIIDLIVNTYQQILQNIKMSHDFDENFDVKFETKCPGSDYFEEKNNCDKVRIADEIQFRVKITPLDCIGPNKSYTIKADGIDESLTIDLEVICACDCEINIESTDPDETCNNNGYKNCGICKCFEGYSGEHCECTHTSGYTNDTNCVDPQTNKICNENGDCKCGMCQCKDNYYGKFCKCEDGSCPRVSGELCGGPNQGKCLCGECKCLSGWTEDDCSCPISNTQCIAPYSDGKPCSEKGKCICGKCVCETDYFGDFCEGCTGCEWCEDLDPCVEAYLKEIDLSEAKSLRINCTSVNIIPRENATAEFYDPDWNKCLLGGKLGCNTVYRYKFDKTEVLIHIGEEICPFVASLGGLLLTILLPIILGGLMAFFAWKGIVTVKDKREYANFLKKRDEEKWNTDLNPLYKSAETTYMNPTFQKSK